MYRTRYVILSSHQLVADAQTPVLTVAATLSSKSPFITPFGREQEADTVKRSFKVENSDFLTFHRVLVGWREAIVAGNHMSYTRKNFMSHQVCLLRELCECLIESVYAESDTDRRAAAAIL